MALQTTQRHIIMSWRTREGMTLGEYLAHKREDGAVQLLRDHLAGTGKLAFRFADEFGAGNQGALAGCLHDIGKYSEAFQKRLLSDGPIVDHSTAGAKECWKMKQPFAAFGVAGHHAGLPDLGRRDDRCLGAVGD